MSANAPTPEMSDEQRLFEHLRLKAQQQSRQDREERNDPWVRIYSVLLAEALKPLIEQYAGEMLAKQDKPTDIFFMDEAGETLLWQLVEFLSQAHFDRDDEAYFEAVRYTQLDRDHAASWFNVTEYHESGRRYSRLTAPETVPTESPSLIVRD